MTTSLFRFLSLLFTALALAPAAAHVLELPRKMGMSRPDYHIVQKLYQGWSWLGIVVVGALISTLLLAILVRARRIEFAAALVAFFCIVCTQAVFWMYTAPVNKATNNWTFMPEHWMALRAQWEYSHAASAALGLCAFIAVSISVLSGRK